MEKKELLAKTEEFVRQTLTGEGSGHDWWHIDCVRKTALHIARQEKSDLFIVELAALLHDIADWKTTGDEKSGGKVAGAWLFQQGADASTTAHVVDIIDSLSFKGAGVATPMKTVEGQIVQDADRLQALGAIGIARCFTYGGHKGREMYNPTIKPELHASFAQYKNSKGTTLNHFYEKLLLLKERMNTPTARTLAAERHEFMEQYLRQFFSEWDLA